MGCVAWVSRRLGRRLAPGFLTIGWGWIGGPNQATKRLIASVKERGLAWVGFVVSCSWGLSRGVRRRLGSSPPVRAPQGTGKEIDPRATEDDKTWGERSYSRGVRGGWNKGLKARRSDSRLSDRLPPSSPWKPV